jgi:hypothetical protein
MKNQQNSIEVGDFVRCCCCQPDKGLRGLVINIDAFGIFSYLSDGDSAHYYNDKLDLYIKVEFDNEESSLFMGRTRNR